MTIKICRKAGSILSHIISIHSSIWIKISCKRDYVFHFYDVPSIFALKITLQEWQYL